MASISGSHWTAQTSWRGSRLTEKSRGLGICRAIARLYLVGGKSLLIGIEPQAELDAARLSAIASALLDGSLEP